MYIKYLNPDLNKFKKQRNPNKQMKGDLLNISTFSCNNETNYCLNYFTQKETDCIITFTKGDIDISNWRAVYTNIKRKLITLNGKVVTFSNFEKSMRKETKGTITIKEIEKPFKLREYLKILKKLKKNFLTTKEDCFKYLWKNRKKIKYFNIRRLVKKILYDYIDYKYHITLKKHLIIKLPYYHNLNRNTIKKIIQSLFVKLPFFIRKLLNAKIKIVFKRRKNIGDILCNHIKFSNKINANFPIFSCNSASNNTKEHIAIKLEDVNFLTEEEKELIRLKDIPFPHSPNNFYNCKTEIKNVMQRLIGTLNDDMTKKINNVAWKITNQGKEKHLILLKKNKYYKSKARLKAG